MTVDAALEDAAAEARRLRAVRAQAAREIATLDHIAEAHPGCADWVSEERAVWERADEDARAALSRLHDAQTGQLARLQLHLAVRSTALIASAILVLSLAAYAALR